MKARTKAAHSAKNRIKVLHLVAGNLYGGVETILVAIARYRKLCHQMQHSFILCYEGRLSRELEAEGADVQFVPPARLSRPWMIRRARRALAARLTECPAQVIISHHVWPLVVFGPVLQQEGCPVCVYLHGPTKSSTWLNRWAARRRPDQLVAVSDHTLRTFRPVFPRTPAEVIYNPMPWPQSELTAVEWRRMRDSLATSTDAVVILQASRMEALKGQDILLNALHKMRDLPGWVCWFAGGSQRPHEEKFFNAIRRQAAELELEERVRFLGERNDVLRLMGAADIYCQGNRGPEGFSMAFLEAFSSGLPIVTSAIGGALEMIDDSCGRLVTAKNPEAISIGLRELVTDPALRNRLGAAAKRRVHELSDPANQLNRLHSVLAALDGVPKA